MKFLTCPIDISVIFCLHIVSNGNAQHMSMSRSYHKVFLVPFFVPEVAKLYLSCGGSSCVQPVECMAGVYGVCVTSKVLLVRLYQKGAV